MAPVLIIALIQAIKTLFRFPLISVQNEVHVLVFMILNKNHQIEVVSLVGIILNRIGIEHIRQPSIPDRQYLFPNFLVHLARPFFQVRKQFLTPLGVPKQQYP